MGRRSRGRRLPSRATLARRHERAVRGAGGPLRDPAGQRRRGLPQLPRLPRAGPAARHGLLLLGGPQPGAHGRHRHRLLAGRRRRPRPHHAHGHGARAAGGRDRPGRGSAGRAHPRALRPHRRAPGLHRNRCRGHHDQRRVRLLDRADGPPRAVRAHHRGQRARPSARAARGRPADPGRPFSPDSARHRADPGRRAHPRPGDRHRRDGRGTGRAGLGRGPLLRGAGTGPAVLHRGEPRGHVRRLRPDP